MHRYIALPATILMLTACSTEEDGNIYADEGGQQTSITVGDSDPGDDSDGGEANDDVGEESEDEGGVKLDLGEDTGNMTAGDDGGDGNGCKKVDFLFVIDNSGSMAEEQDNLAASFPAFMNSIESTLDEAQDFHIMVIDVDAWVYAGCETLCLLFPNLPGVCEGYVCGETQPEQCEDVLGAGVTSPKGANASNTDCNFSSGKRFIDATEPSLVSAFQCAARVGTDSTNDPERPMEAMVAAVSDSGAVATCNYDFLRDDAILVVTFITDENDDAEDGSAGTVESWRQALITAKNGDESAVVVLGLFGDGDLPDAICGSLDNGGAEQAPRLRQFVDSWDTRGFFGSICAPDYDAFFQEAVEIIDTTCDEFTPPK
ncbi:hypothetical protein G6O69_30210 [Pseudenhygromyxa sp. WMMC2535]|uniref:hypothetical protein n=1 Tax=Pseudenhygromyxa sp. WMMC2535 TaxID=2712867 RepID=UPI0015571CB9|nr:hypothetical protein [Pseudenhygromyxa sp. WMMC2535]NVB42135.1 hypothetical protein [Pseudenhygromyxa sp. WMMC2535]